MWFILNPGALSQHMSGLGKFQEVSYNVRVAVTKKVNNVAPLNCRVVIRGFLMSVHIVLFIFNLFCVSF